MKVVHIICSHQWKLRFVPDAAIEMQREPGRKRQPRTQRFHLGGIVRPKFARASDYLFVLLFGTQ